MGNVGAAVAEPLDVRPAGPAANEGARGHGERPRAAELCAQGHDALQRKAVDEAAALSARGNRSVVMTVSKLHDPVHEQAHTENIRK